MVSRKVPESADSVKFVESMDAGGAGHAVPIVTAAFAPQNPKTPDYRHSEGILLSTLI